MNAILGQPPKDLSQKERSLKAKLEKDIKENLEGFRKVGAALTTIRDQYLYREDYATFEEYLREEWDMNRNRAYRLIAAVDVVSNLLPIGNKEDDANFSLLPANEAQARPLTILPEDKQRIVWGMVIECSEADSVKITAMLVQQCVDSFLNTNIEKALRQARAASKRREFGIPEPVQLTFQSFLEEVQREADSNWNEIGKKNMAKMLRELLESIEA